MTEIYAIYEQLKKDRAQAWEALYAAQRAKADMLLIDEARDNVAIAEKIFRCAELSMPIERQFIPYGKGYNAALNAMTNDQYLHGEWFVLSQNVHLTPYYKAYQLADGRVLHLTESTQGDHVALFHNWAQWNRHQHDNWVKYYADKVKEQ